MLLLYRCYFGEVQSIAVEPRVALKLVGSGVWESPMLATKIEAGLWLKRPPAHFKIVPQVQNSVGRDERLSG